MNTPENEVLRTIRVSPETDEAFPKELIRKGFESKISSVFPEFTTIDLKKWDNELPDRALGFSRGERSPSTPELRVLFKANGGFTINMANNPLGFGTERHIATPATTVYKDFAYGHGTDWGVGELNEAVEAADMFTRGIPLTPEIVDQPAFVRQSEQGNNIVTIRSLIEKAQEYKTAVGKKPIKAQAGEMKILQPEDIYKLNVRDPEIVKKLIAERLSYQSAHSIPFRVNGRDFDPEEIKREIEKDTLFGHRAATIEMIRTGVYLELLWGRGIIRPGKSPVIKLP